jgi:hypothetical protein
MNTTRSTARTVGVLFIVATVLGVLGTSLSRPILGAPDYLTRVSASAGTVTMGALLEVIAALACAGIAIGLYPVLRKHHEGLALGAVGFRLIETVFYVVAVLGLLSLLTLSEEFVKASVSDGASFQASGALLLAARKWAGELGVVAFALGGLSYYYAFFQSRLIPRWLSGWGVLGVTLSLATALLVILGQMPPLSTAFIVMNVPIGLQEQVLAVWLIVKGFSPAAVAARPAEPATKDVLMAA